MATTDEINNMSGPDLADAVAREVMGWELEWNSSEFDSWWIVGENPRRSKDGWRPNKDRNDAYRVLKRCEELGSGIVWKVWAIIRKRSGDPQHRDPYPWEWRLFSIDPAIICRAALRAVREARK